MSQDDQTETPSQSEIPSQEGQAPLEPAAPASPPAGPGVRRVAVTAAIFSAVVLVFAISYYIRTAGGEPQVVSPSKCYSCGYIGYQKLKVGESMPPCPKCGKATYCPAFKCPKCGNLEVLNEYRGLEGPTKCSKCGTEIPRPR